MEKANGLLIFVKSISVNMKNPRKNITKKRLEFQSYWNEFSGHRFIDNLCQTTRKSISENSKIDLINFILSVKIASNVCTLFQVERKPTSAKSLKTI